MCVDVAGESRATLTALQMLMDAQVFHGVSKIQGSCEIKKYGCANAFLAAPVCLQVRIAQRQDRTQGQQMV